MVYLHLTLIPIFFSYVRGFRTVGRPPRGALLVLFGATVVCLRAIFILDEIWTQDKSIYFGGNFAWLRYFTYHLVPKMAPNYKQHILLPTEVSLFSLSQHVKKKIKIKWHCCRSSYSFRINMPTKGIIALGFIFVYKANTPYYFPSCVVRSVRQRFKSGPK
jgi:hypothetical protein